MSAAEKSKVYLVGAGPGDAELLTLKAARLLSTADLVLHDDLVPPPVVGMAGKGALVLSVGKRCGDPTRIRQQDIHSLMVDGAKRGLSVVRLKSGDPLIFGRAGEEIDALTNAGIQFEVVPGITAAFAAAAALGCSFTDRRSASSVEFRTGHYRDHGSSPELRDSGDLGRSSATRVLYMPGHDYQAIAEAWLSDGESPALPCCLVSRAAQPDQSIHWTTLAELPHQPIATAPAILVAGWALAARMQQDESALPTALPTELQSLNEGQHSA